MTHFGTAGRNTTTPAPTRRVHDVTLTGALFTLAEAKEILGVVDTNVASLDAVTDARLQATIDAAQQWCEQTVWRTYRATATRTLELDRWPDQRIVFEDPPLLSVQAVNYIDADDAAQVLPSAEYIVIASTIYPGELYFREGFTRPALISDRPDAVSIDYTAGYNAVANLPAVVKQAGELMLTRYWDDEVDLPVLEQYESAARSLLDGEQWGHYG